MKNNLVNALSKMAVKSLCKQLDNGAQMDAEGCKTLAKAVMQGKIKVEAHSDTFWRYEDLTGDVFCPQVNNDICPEKLKREERNFKARSHLLATLPLHKFCSQFRVTFATPQVVTATYHPADRPGLGRIPKFCR